MATAARPIWGMVTAARVGGWSKLALASRGGGEVDVGALEDSLGCTTSSDGDHRQPHLLGGGDVLGEKLEGNRRVELTFTQHTLADHAVAPKRRTFTPSG